MLSSNCNGSGGIVDLPAAEIFRGAFEVEWYIAEIKSIMNVENAWGVSEDQKKNEKRKVKEKSSPLASTPYE